MTSDDLQKLKEMSQSDIARKYTPLLLSKKITPKQYDWLCYQGKNTEEVMTDEILQPVELKDAMDWANETVKLLENELGAKEVESIQEDDKTCQNVKLSQKQAILNLLMDGEYHSTIEIIEKVYKISGHTGYCNIHARMTDLRNDGYNIPKATHDHGTVYKYILLK